MLDEFPTLEAVAAIGVLTLILRTLLVVSEMRSVPGFTPALAKLLREGQRGEALAACSAADAPALGRAARELITLVGDPPFRSGTALELTQEQGELELELVQRAESARARDLVVLAVLLGAMAFAAVSRLHVTVWFYALASLGVVLLVVGYLMRGRLRNIARTELRGIGDALKSSLQEVPSVRPQRPSLPSLVGGCSNCGELDFLVAAGALLGEPLLALGVTELRICKHCGLIGGQARDAQALSSAALPEVTVPLDPDAESVFEDPEHDG